MKPFAAFITANEVREETPDPTRAESLEVDARERLAYACHEKPNDQNAKFIVENVYEALRAAVEARMTRKGFKSYSHVANIAFTREEGVLTIAEVEYLDFLRQCRNDSRYYGKKTSVAQAREAITRAPSTLKKLLTARKAKKKE